MALKALERSSQGSEAFKRSTERGKLVEAS
jgi:hypothetical protein